jgi:hypothetical protein
MSKVTEHKTKTQVEVSPSVSQLRLPDSESTADIIVAQALGFCARKMGLADHQAVIARLPLQRCQAGGRVPRRAGQKDQSDLHCRLRCHPAGPMFRRRDIRTVDPSDHLGGAKNQSLGLIGGRSGPGLGPAIRRCGWSAPVGPPARHTTGGRPRCGESHRLWCNALVALQPSHSNLGTVGQSKTCENGTDRVCL